MGSTKGDYPFDAIAQRSLGSERCREVQSRRSILKSIPQYTNILTKKRVGLLRLNSLAKLLRNFPANSPNSSRIHPEFIALCFHSVEVETSDRTFAGRGRGAGEEQDERSAKSNRAGTHVRQRDNRRTKGFHQLKGLAERYGFSGILVRL